MNIAVGVLCWIEKDEQLPELKRCLDSLTDFYPVFVINGKWDDFEGNNPRSTDKANDLIDSYSNVIHISSPNKSEAYNRNLYLQLCLKWNIDMLFWVDTDEWVEMPIGFEFAKRGLMDHMDTDDLASCMHYYSEAHGGVGKQKRLLQYPGFLRHHGKHNELFFGDDEVLRYPVPDAPRGIIIYSNKEFRSEDRECRMKKRVEGVPVKKR